MLEKIKELRVKAECEKALLALADDENERKHFKKLLDKYKQELLKFLDERQKYKNEQNAKKPIVEPNEPKYITELKELCQKRKRYQVGDERHELIKVFKNDNGEYLLFFIKNGEDLYKPLTYEIAQNYLQASKEQKWL